MSQYICEDSNHLTTDAVPDAPRQKVTEIVTESEQTKKHEIPSVQVQEESKPKQNNATYTSKPKKKYPTGPSKSAQNTKVINILNSSGVHIGAVNNYNLFSNTNKKKNDVRKTYPRTSEVDSFLAKDELVKRDDLDLVSTHLGDGWRDVGGKLGYSDGQMDHFYADHKHISDKEVVYQMLLDWTRVHPDNSKIGILSTILWDCDQKDVVYRWMKFFY